MISAALLALAAPALAGERDAPAPLAKDPPVFVVSAPVKDKPTIALDSSKGYILLRSDAAVPLYLMRVPSAEDQRIYDGLRAEGLAEAREDYAKDLKKYEREAASWEKASQQQRAAMRRPVKPVEPTDSNFEFTPFGLMAAVGIGPLNRFAKAKGASTYLQEITPGEYRIYGPFVPLAGGGSMGMCYCMGSVKFEVRAGEVTDMGVIMAGQAEIPRAPKGDSSMPIFVDIPNYLGPAPAGMQLDPRLASATVRRAQYKPVGKLPNYFGVTLGRIPEMPGVFRYERDRMVDLTAGN